MPAPPLKTTRTGPLGNTPLFSVASGEIRPGRSGAAVKLRALEGKQTLVVKSSQARSFVAVAGGSGQGKNGVGGNAVALCWVADPASPGEAPGLVPFFKLDAEQVVDCVAVAPHHQALALAYVTPKVCCVFRWSADRTKLEAAAPPVALPALQDHFKDKDIAKNVVVFGPASSATNGKACFCTGGDAGVVQMWALGKAKEGKGAQRGGQPSVETWRRSVVAGTDSSHAQAVTDLAFHPSGAWVAAAVVTPKDKTAAPKPRAGTTVANASGEPLCVLLRTSDGTELGRVPLPPALRQGYKIKTIRFSTTGNVLYAAANGPRIITGVARSRKVVQKPAYIVVWRLEGAPKTPSFKLVRTVLATKDEISCLAVCPRTNDLGVGESKGVVSVWASTSSGGGAGQLRRRCAAKSHDLGASGVAYVSAPPLASAATATAAKGDDDDEHGAVLVSCSPDKSVQLLVPRTVRDGGQLYLLFVFVLLLLVLWFAFGGMAEVQVV